jgi:hypothetical protein
MSTVLGILGFAVLFAAFAYMGPVLLRKMRCGGGGCGACAASACKYKGVASDEPV